MRSRQDPQLTTCHADWPILICLLGGFRLLKRGEPIPIRNAGKSQSLLSALALAPDHCLPREELLHIIWPNAETGLARQSLNSLVYALHKSLGDAIDGAAPVTMVQSYYQLNLTAGVGLDFNWFTALVSAGDQQARQGQRDEALVRYKCALELYQGGLSTGSDLRSLIEAEHLRALYLSLLARLAVESLSLDDWSSCLNYAMRLLAVDPCREDAHRLIMRCYVRLGERAQAFRQFYLCKAILTAEFNAEPEASTLALFEQIRLEPNAV